MEPKSESAACDVSGIRLYQEAVACGLRHPLERIVTGSAILF